MQFLRQYSDVEIKVAEPTVALRESVTGTSVMGIVGEVRLYATVSHVVLMRIKTYRLILSHILICDRHPISEIKSQSHHRSWKHQSLMLFHFTGYPKKKRKSLAISCKNLDGICFRAEVYGRLITSGDLCFLMIQFPILMVRTELFCRTFYSYSSLKSN